MNEHLHSRLPFVDVVIDEFLVVEMMIHHYYSARSPTTVDLNNPSRVSIIPTYLSE